MKTDPVETSTQPLTVDEVSAMQSAEREIIHDEFADDTGELPGQEPGQDAPPSTDLEELRTMVRQLLQAGFGMLATRRGEHWQISEGESEAIADPLAEILNEAGLAVETPEMRLAIAATFVLLPRVMADRKSARGDKAQPVEHTE